MRKTDWTLKETSLHSYTYFNIYILTYYALYVNIPVVIF